MNFQICNTNYTFASAYLTRFYLLYTYFQYFTTFTYFSTRFNVEVSNDMNLISIRKLEESVNLKCNLNFKSNRQVD
jgi:hypothetical protein